jgi:AraC family transcriptional regulator
LTINHSLITKGEFTVAKSQTKLNEAPLPQLEPRIENGKPLLIAGLRSHFTSANWEGIPAQWRRFASYLGKIPGEAGRTAYGLCFQMPDGIDYLSGVEVSGGSGLPSEFSQVSIPAQKYLVFSHPEHVSKLRNTLDNIWHEWLPASGHEFAHPAAGAPGFFERYGEDFDPRTGMGGIEVWIPIKA